MSEHNRLALRVFDGPNLLVPYAAVVVKFASRDEMGAFCRQLFDIRGVGDDTAADAVERYLGVCARDSQLGMNWELYFVLAARDAEQTGPNS